MRIAWCSLICLSVVLGASCSHGKGKHVSDATLLQTFHEQRATLEKLKLLILQNPTLARVNLHTSQAEPASADDKQVAMYRYLLVNAGCQQGFADQGGNVWIRASVDDLGMESGLKSSYKGYCFRTTKPDLVAQKLDSYPGPFGSDFTAVYRPIEESWYLYLTPGGP